MQDRSGGAAATRPGPASALGEEPIFGPSDPVRIASRSPIGHTAAIDNEEEGYGRNAGTKPHYYRIAIPMTEIWPDYVGSPRDGLRIEVCETWLEGI
jgi:hypothetical protein